jgi:hypothetical protein
MTDVIDVHDLPKEQATLLKEFAEFLRKKFKSNQFVKEEREKEKEWSKLAITSFTIDWENEKDAVYDDWRKYYHVPER